MADDDLEARARACLPPMHFDYVAGGADDEWTLGENRRAWSRIQLLPRVLGGLGPRQLATTVLGTSVSLPVLVAPTAFHGLMHGDAEVGSARAAARAGTIFTASTMSNRSLEDIASAGGSRWFQLYFYRDVGLVRSLVDRAVAAGYTALVVTVDAPFIGHRRSDAANQFRLPEGLTLGNFAGEQTSFPDADGSGLSAYVANQLEPGLGWEHIERLRSMSSLPIVLKGILSPVDAREAVERGIDAIVVSNHGGRQLDGVPAGITVLSRVVDAVEGGCEVLVDGGVRRGTDILKALALGARAVLVGRPVLWGLAVDGEDGAFAVLETLRRELDLAMALAGVRDVREASPGLLFP